MTDKQVNLTKRTKKQIIAEWCVVKDV